MFRATGTSINRAIKGLKDVAIEDVENVSCHGHPSSNRAIKGLKGGAI